MKSSVWLVHHLVRLKNRTPAREPDVALRAGTLSKQPHLSVRILDTYASSIQCISLKFKQFLTCNNWIKTQTTRKKAGAFCEMYSCRLFIWAASCYRAFAAANLPSATMEMHSRRVLLEEQNTIVLRQPVFSMFKLLIWQSYCAKVLPWFLEMEKKDEEEMFCTDANSGPVQLRLVSVLHRPHWYVVQWRGQREKE